MKQRVVIVRTITKRNLNLNKKMSNFRVACVARVSVETKERLRNGIFDVCPRENGARAKIGKKIRSPANGARD